LCVTHQITPNIKKGCCHNLKVYILKSYKISLKPYKSCRLSLSRHGEFQERRSVVEAGLFLAGGRKYINERRA
jgi:hypothetical protein